jgi:bacillithiol system protein YtxJ
LFHRSDSLTPKASWLELRTADQLDEIFRLSSPEEGRAGVVVFKHSTRCSISRMVIRNLISEWDILPEKLPFYYLDLLQHRDLSAAIAVRFEVLHESPQLLLLMNGKCALNLTHGDVSVEEVKRFLALG